MGGLVLTAKPDELDNWRRYLEEVGRPPSDLVELSPQQPHRFNFLDFELAEAKRASHGLTLTYNMVSLFLAALSTGEGAVSRVDPYWNDALRELLTHAIDLAVLSVGTVELADLAAIIRTAPQSRAEVRSAAWQSSSRCYQLLRDANEKASLLATENRGRFLDLKQTVAFWLGDFPALNDRTRSIIVSSFTSKVAGLLRTPLRELFCTETSRETDPAVTHRGKVIVLNLPVKLYGEVGRFAQVLYKTVWQRATERREFGADWRPVFLWADESQLFITSEDMLFQQTARSRFAATVYLTQNLPNYYAALGGQRDHAATESLLGNLQTKMFHANGDPTTNEWAERMMGKRLRRLSTFGSQSGGGQLAGGGHNATTISASQTPTLLAEVQAGEFTTLAKGGVRQDKTVDAYVFQGGRAWESNGRKNYILHRFQQS